jgi:hypothetical protein
MSVNTIIWKRGISSLDFVSSDMLLCFFFRRLICVRVCVCVLCVCVVCGVSVGGVCVCGVCVCM